MLANTQSIACAFGLASAAPRSPYRHLELCGIALELVGRVAGEVSNDAVGICQIENLKDGVGSGLVVQCSNMVYRGVKTWYTVL